MIKVCEATFIFTCPAWYSILEHGWFCNSLSLYYPLVINIIPIIIIYQYHSPNIGHRMIRIPPYEAIFTSAKAPPCSSHTLLFISSRLFHHHHQNLCFHHHHHLHYARKTHHQIQLHYCWFICYYYRMRWCSEWPIRMNILFFMKICFWWCTTHVDKKCFWCLLWCFLNYILGRQREIVNRM